jgi:Ca2+-binding RTX toxin-like protein
MAQFPANIDVTSLDGTTGFRLNGTAASDFSGYSVASAGDVNGDGFADVIVGAVEAASPAAESGASYVVFGKASGFAANIDLSTLDGATGFKLSGAAANDFAGQSVASAGDVNGDGFADLIIGATGAAPHGSSSGASYVVFGHASGFAANIDLSTLDGATGFKLSGEATGDFSGHSVASAGDFNGDGFADVIVGAPGAPSFHFTGASYVVFGRASGFAANLDLSSLDSSTGFKLSGANALDQTGCSVASAGDVNGDGFADLIIGAYAAKGIGLATGASYVVFGQASGFDAITGFTLRGSGRYDQAGYSVASAGDVNGDGFADMIVGANLAGNYGASYVVFGKASGFAANIVLASVDGVTGFAFSTGTNYSGFSVASAGDVNGDGFSDVIVAAKHIAANGHVDAGAAYVLFGKASGFAAGIDLASVDGSTGFKLSGVPAADFSGRPTVASAGDVNGDGFADLIVGAPTANPHGNYSGASYVVFGKLPDAAVNRSGTDASQTLAGGDFADTLSGLGGDDTLHGNGGNDMLVGGSGADTMIGGLGDDIYSVDNIGDLTIENANGGTDTVQADTHYQLLANLENLVLLGTADLQGYGNELANTLVSNFGIDFLAGGAGDDTYFVQNPGDAVLENANEGADTVFSAAHLVLAANVENLILQGSADLQGYGNGDVNTLTGNAGNNLLDGRGGADVMLGGAGNDAYVVDDAGDQVIENPGEGNDAVFSTAHFVLTANVEALVLQGSADLQGYGNSDANTITGNAGSNLLDGRGGADYMAGGAGNDVYFVDDGGDAVIENAGEGRDAIFSTAHYALPANVEILVLQGSADLQGYGNGDANMLYGNAGSNLLDGRGGADYMAGGAGNDVYFVDNAGDLVFENSGEGTDAVFATVDYTLTANVETLVQQGSGNLAGTGNGLANKLYGNSGDNTLDGGAGVDRLTGNAGNDIFVFHVGEADSDIVVDFAGNGAAAGDSLQFVGYGAGATFTQNDATHWQVTYNSGASTEIITLLNGASIDPTDFAFT